MISNGTAADAGVYSSVHLLPKLETECGVSERLVEIVADPGKSAQQRVSEAVAFAATRGWETCSIFELAPDLIREVELRCPKDRQKRLLLSIVDGEDGNERLQIAYTSRTIAWDRTM